MIQHSITLCKWFNLCHTLSDFTWYINHIYRPTIFFSAFPGMFVIVLLWLFVSPIQHELQKLYVALVVKTGQLSHLCLSEMGQQAQFPHFWQITPKYISREASCQSSRPVVITGLLEVLKNDVISLSFSPSTAPSILSVVPLPLASLWIKSPCSLLTPLG